MDAPKERAWEPWTGWADPQSATLESKLEVSDLDDNTSCLELVSLWSTAARPVASAPTVLCAHCYGHAYVTTSRTTVQRGCLGSWKQISPSPSNEQQPSSASSSGSVLSRLPPKLAGISFCLCLNGSDDVPAKDGTDERSQNFVWSDLEHST